MPYEGAKLHRLFPRHIVELTGRRMVATGSRALKERIREFTPIETGELAASYYIGLIRKGRGGWWTTVATDVEHGPYVEYGTGLFGPKRRKYPILPRKPGGVLHWVNEHGEHVFARKVMHPGSPGNHMFAIGAMVTERTLGVILEPEVRQWARLTEQHIRRHRRG